MPGEQITTDTIPEAKEELRNIYKSKSQHFEELEKAEYEAFEESEREDSDNHLNEEKFKAGEAPILDLAHYKYLEDHKVAYKIFLQNAKGETAEDYFVIVPEA